MPERCGYVVVQLHIANGARLWRREVEDQWQYPVRVDNINAAIANKACWLFEEAGSPPIATVTLDEFADPALWRPSDVPKDALYLHRLVVSHGRRREITSVRQ